ncbi:MAG TPA: hypothetical protein VGS08_01500 [Candidatus Saccharimonadales bacterium]|nr:hypothetical protein [Candidatus Saccharimonadales bacterium]
MKGKFCGEVTPESASVTAFAGTNSTRGGLSFKDEEGFASASVIEVQDFMIDQEASPLPPETMQEHIQAAVPKVVDRIGRCNGPGIVPRAGHDSYIPECPAFSEQAVIALARSALMGEAGPTPSSP